MQKCVFVSISFIFNLEHSYQMNKSIFIAIFLFFTIFAMGATKPSQYQITGQVLEESTGKAIPYATITLLSDSGKVLTKLCSEVSGKFTIPSNEKRAFKLVFTAVGFNELKLAGKIEELKTEVGIVKMKEGIALKEVAVTAQKPLIKVDVDKITYSMESDPDSKTNNALEMLRKVPMITVDGDENVTLNGQSNYKVLVNGKSSSMMSKNFKEVIKSFPANTIKDIEVITNPSSKYDAEGIGGIINIITIKKTLNGYNGSVSSGFDSFGGINGSLYLSAKVNKFGFSGRYSANQMKRPESRSFSNRENFLSADQHYTNQVGTSTNSGISQNFNVEASYDIDSLKLLSMSFWGYLGNSVSKSNSSTEIQNIFNQRTSAFGMESDGKYSYGSVSGNIDYQKTYKKPDKTFTISYKLDNNPYSYNFETSTKDTYNYADYNQITKSDDFTREQTVQVDYYDPLTKKHQIEFGVKGIYRENNSNSDVLMLNSTSNSWEPDVNRSNELDYNQTIVGAYGGYVYKLKKFSAKSGLRAELTWNDAYSKSVRDTSFNNTLKNIVPYVTFSYKLNPSMSLKASYTQRLQRPSIWYLNPYRNDMDRLNVRYGNPNLKSEIAHSFELGFNSFTPKFNLGVTGTTSFANNSIEEISRIDANNIRYSTYENIGKNFKVGMNTFTSYRPTGKFNIGFNGGVYYTQLEAYSLGTLIKNDGFNFRGSLNTRISLWKDAAVNANWGIFTSSIQLQGKSSAYNYTSLGLSQYFLKKKLSLNLSVNDPFRKEQKYIYDSATPTYTMHRESFRPSRSLRVSLSYNFGKMGETVKKAKRSIQNDDMKSGGGGEGAN